MKTTEELLAINLELVNALDGLTKIVKTLELNGNIKNIPSDFRNTLTYYQKASREILEKAKHP